jgi:predicted kinase
VPRLVLVNGAPGCGKSTISDALARDNRMMLALDIDRIKHSLGRWNEDPAASGMQARRLALALVREQLRCGLDVVVGQYLARPTFIETLGQAASQVDAQFVELILHLDAPVLAARLAERVRAPDRAEHVVNNTFVGPEDACALADSIVRLRRLRPYAHLVDARGSVSDVLARVKSVLAR